MNAPSQRTRIRRKPKRAHYDVATIRAIVDAAFICHIAFADGEGVHCLPMACWRDGDHLYIHGANNSRLIGALLAGECAVCITHLDGLVLARSAMHHSMNYRSAVVYGRFAEVAGEEDKARAMAAFLEHVSPGRGREVRAPSRAELAGTRVLRLPLHEAAAKIRNWGVEDDAGDMDIPVWAVVIPIACRPGTPEPEDGCAGRGLPALPLDDSGTTAGRLLSDSTESAALQPAE